MRKCWCCRQDLRIRYDTYGSGRCRVCGALVTRRREEAYAITGSTRTSKVSRA
jgi:hypothetical protein